MTPRERIRYYVRAGIVFVGIPLLPMLLSWRWDWPEAWVFFVITVLGSFGGRALAEWKNPGILAERMGSLENEEAPKWDRVLAPLMALGGLFIPLLAGLEARSPWVDFPLWAEGVGLALLVVGYVVASWAMIANPFFSGTVHIQEERGHRVADKGPYRVVRHPGYVGAVLAFTAPGLLLDSVWGVPVAVALVVVTIVRTAKEDAYLQENLPGYAAFTERTRWRLVPFVW